MQKGPLVSKKGKQGGSSWAVSLRRICFHFRGAYGAEPEPDHQLDEEGGGHADRGELYASRRVHGVADLLSLGAGAKVCTQIPGTRFRAHGQPVFAVQSVRTELRTGEITDVSWSWVRSGPDKAAGQRLGKIARESKLAASQVVVWSRIGGLVM